MRFVILFFVFIGCFLNTDAQFRRRSALFNLTNEFHQKGKVFNKPVFLQQVNLVQGSNDSVIKNSVKFHLNTSAVTQVFQDKQNTISLVFPFTADKTYTLDLVEQKINTSGDFTFGEITADGVKQKISQDEGLHYRGCIAGDSTSIAAFSIFANGEIMGLFSNSEGNFVIGKMKDTDEYVLYKSEELQVPVGINCSTEDLDDAVDVNFAAKPADPLAAPALLCKKVRYYWEADYNLYRYNFNSNITNVQNYLTGLFNQFAAIYQNEGITMELSDTYVWTTQDPYRTASSAEALSDFRARWNNLGNNFNGDAAHLISGGVTFYNGAAGNGGRAQLNILCSRSSAYAYSNVWATYKNYPTYSWDVEVVTHETGHNLGSKHTHWCGWNTGAGGACGAIDNCNKLESGSSCDTCYSSTDIKALPSGWKGTIMSYCHLVNNAGIDLSQGFGPLPQATIRGRVAASSCLVSNSYWTGATDSLWSNAANWSCNAIPDANTDVIIQTGVARFPVIKSSAVCRKLNTLTGGNLKVNTSFSLLVAGQKTLPLITPPLSSKLYITGTATPGGLMNAGDPELLSQKFTQVSNTLYEIRSLYLTGGASYVFVPQYGDWSSKYGYTGTALMNNVSKDGFKLNGTDIKAPVTSGYYSIGADFQLAKFFVATALPKVTVPASNELFITGTATPGGLMTSGASPLLSQKFTKISNTLYEIASVPLTAGGTYSFVPVYGNWSIKYGGTGATGSNNVNGDYFKSTGTNLAAPAVSGNYKITVDFQLGVFSLIKL